MNMPLRTTLQGLSADEVAAAPVIRFVTEHYDGLWHAARLLGGSTNCRLVDRLIQDFEQSRRLTPRIKMMLAQLVALLTLENVHDFDQPEPAFFAELSPEDPVVPEICLLSDGLQAVMAHADADLRRLSAHAPVRQVA